MYKTVVAREVGRAWAALNEGDYEAVLRGFGPRFRYENIAADHALGGTFTNREELTAHFDLLFRAFRNLRFEVQEILVAGSPRSTSVVVHVGVLAQLPDGTPYENEIVQRMSMRWGKVTEVRALIDNVRARAAIDALARDGLIATSTAPSGASS